MNSHQYGAANGAIKNKGILSGVWIEKAEFGSPGEFEQMSDAELITSLRERWAKLESELAGNEGSILLNGASSPDPEGS